MQEHSMTHIKTGFGFDCPVSLCNMQFSQHNALRAHLEETHTISSTNPSPSKRTLTLSLMDKEKSPFPEKDDEENVECGHCGMVFFDNTMYLLHQSLHSEGDPFKSALCGTQCEEKYMFTNPCHLCAS